MRLIARPLPGLKVLEPTVFGDHRGYFYESYNLNAFTELGIPDVFVQDNQSFSQKGVLRGLHFQVPPHEQGKLVRVIKGSVLDVVVDIRKGSPAYGKHAAVELNETNRYLFWVPPGFAHGFAVLENNTIFSYKCTGMYNPASERGVQYNDPALDINWLIEKPVLSEKDLKNPTLQDLDSPFTYEDESN